MLNFYNENNILGHFLIVMVSAKPAMDLRVLNVIVVMQLISISRMNAFPILARLDIFLKIMLF